MGNQKLGQTARKVKAYAAAPSRRCVGFWAGALSLVVTFTLGGCIQPDNSGNAVRRQGSQSSVGGSSGPATLSLSPAGSYLRVSQSLSLQVTAGSPRGAISFAIVSGEGSIGELSGIFTAGMNAGTVRVRATDSSGAWGETEISVYAPIALKNAFPRPRVQSNGRTPKRSRDSTHGWSGFVHLHARHDHFELRETRYSYRLHLRCSCKHRCPNGGMS